MRSMIKCLFIWVIVALGARALAQMSADPVLMLGGSPAGAAFQAKPGMVTMRVESMDAAPVKGAPFCATVTTEHTQSLVDGNRIHTNESSMLCRDSEGRTRREAGLNLLGASQQTSAPKLITIVDPVAGVRYLLDTENKIAQKMPLMPGEEVAAAGGMAIAKEPGALHGPGKQIMIYQRTGGPGSDVSFSDVTIKKSGADSGEPAPNSENLGDETVDGIHVTGTRVTTTIPAGKMGNEKPITVTSERWYSPELKATIVTKHDDPWAGELKTELKNVNTSEPDPSLFVVPSDYKVIDDKEGPIRIKLREALPPQ
jgi:hypothetical protein